MRAFEIEGGSLGEMLAKFLEAKGLGCGEDCICRRGETETPADWRKQLIEEAERTIEAEKISLKYLNDPVRDDKELMGLDISALKLRDATAFQIIATYGSKDSDEYMIVYTDQREGKGEKVYNVHGIGAIRKVTQSIQDSLCAEADAMNEADKAD